MAVHATGGNLSINGMAPQKRKMSKWMDISVAIVFVFISIMTLMTYLFWDHGPHTGYVDSSKDDFLVSTIVFFFATGVFILACFKPFRGLMLYVYNTLLCITFIALIGNILYTGDRLSVSEWAEARYGVQIIEDSSYSDGEIIVSKDHESLYTIHIPEDGGGFLLYGENGKKELPVIVDDSQ